MNLFSMKNMVKHYEKKMLMFLKGQEKKMSKILRECYKKGLVVYLVSFWWLHYYFVTLTMTLQSNVCQQMYRSAINSIIHSQLLLSTLLWHHFGWCCAIILTELCGYC